MYINLPQIFAVKGDDLLSEDIWSVYGVFESGIFEYREKFC